MSAEDIMQVIELQEQVEKLNKTIVNLKKAVEHAQYCDYPDSVRFRCKDCAKAERLLKEKR